MVRKLSEKVQFLQFSADLSKKSKLVKEIYIHASESSHYILSENGMVYRGPSHRYEILAIEISKICWLSRNLTKFFNFKY